MDGLKILREEINTRFKTEEEVDAFMEGFEKQAAGYDFLTKALPVAAEAAGGFLAKSDWPSAVAKVGIGLAGGLVGALIIKGLNSSGGYLSNNTLKSKFDFALTQVKNNNKIVKNANPVKVQSYANTLFTFAPNVASDPNLLSSLLANAILGEGVDPITIKSITDLEGRYKENHASSPLLGIRV